jgi:hypothetical protein
MRLIRKHTQCIPLVHLIIQRRLDIVLMAHLHHHILTLTLHIPTQHILMQHMLPLHLLHQSGADKGSSLTTNTGGMLMRIIHNIHNSKVIFQLDNLSRIHLEVHLQERWSILAE